MFRRKSKGDSTEQELDELRRREEEIARRYREAEQQVREVPKRRREAMATLPPPDDLRDRKREYKFYAELATRGQVRNEVRAQAGNVLLLLLLIAALAAVALWMMQIVQGG
jgi:hypothetical protein